MAEGALNTRISIESQDEIGELGSSFNYMAEQLENLLKTQRSFVSNAAHELRTPLMSLKLRIEALTDPDLEDRAADGVPARAAPRSGLHGGTGHLAADAGAHR